MKTLNVVGAGRVGRTLSRLWSENGTFAVQDVLDGTLEGARAAVAFISTGTPVSTIEAMRLADVWMLTTPDRTIASCCDALVGTGLLRDGDVVFHCSGALSSDILRSAASVGAWIASTHPLKTFAEPSAAARTFTGTHCACEGTPGALRVLIPAFECIGGRVSELDARSKTLYHAASVIVSNYLVALMEVGLRCYEAAGIERATALEMIAPLARESLDNALALTPAGALTGPIARGDASIVAEQLQALGTWDANTLGPYRELGLVALELARGRGVLCEAAAARLEALLGRREPDE